ncbi:protein of unknown function (plasmid) [Cupriavidus taiwanensis]|uniref:Uncharacterized protein n=1 Tax=Cupriavidus taiwanensis TaxID=164546 RepID=A0A9Q7UXN4_9BURK|nr:protein of unknown function [Cupriavidus taiwanensis]
MILFHCDLYISFYKVPVSELTHLTHFAYVFQKISW